MSDFVSRLRLAEKAAEDIYFAKVSRELIVALHKQMQAEKNSLARAEDARAAMKENVRGINSAPTHKQHL